MNFNAVERSREDKVRKDRKLRKNRELRQIDFVFLAFFSAKIYPSP